MDRSYALLLLFVRLKQVRSTEAVLRIFSGAVSELWPDHRAEVRVGKQPSVPEEPVERFPLATSTRRYGELLVHSEDGAEELSGDDRVLLFNAVELLQLVLENRDRGAEMEELKGAVEEGVRRRSLATLDLMEQIISVHGHTAREEEPHEDLSRRLRWLRTLDEVLQESRQRGEGMSGGELEGLIRLLFERSVTPPPRLSSGFATVSSAAAETTVDSGSYAVLLGRELLEGVRHSLWKRDDPMDVAISIEGSDGYLLLSITLALGATEGSPRSLNELNRRLFHLFAKKGGIEVEESWEWGSARFALRMESL